MVLGRMVSGGVKGGGGERGEGGRRASLRLHRNETRFRNEIHSLLEMARSMEEYFTLR